MIWLTQDAREVRGIELIPEAVRDARDNAQASGIDLVSSRDVCGGT
ncbi:hypothetical protein [Paenibacillus paeoniae]|nr:hypothetical protein [Paenibacillus paeoniae]